jgi:6-pyruvoyltetrahydropterin/6-carboxytetrahydropterin synthase
MATTTRWTSRWLRGTAAPCSTLALVEPSKTFVLPYNPTAENMARYLLEVVAPTVLGDLPIQVQRIVVWETDTSCATATR